jgi:hypothetical protein
VCVLVVTLSRASVPVRPAASCFPLHGHAAGQRISGSAGVCWCPGALLLLGLVPVKLFLWCLQIERSTLISSPEWLRPLSSGRPAPGAPFVQRLVRARSTLSAIYFLCRCMSSLEAPVSPFDFLFDFSVRSLSSTGYLVSRTRENIVPSVHRSLRAGAIAKILV